MSRAPVRLIATPSQTVGPFFHFGLAENVSLGRLAGPHTKGERITLRIRVLDGDSLPVPDSLIELWHADADGRYVRPPAAASIGTPPDFSGFGRLPTSADGSCVFETIRPGRVTGVDGVLQASHIDVCAFARGLLRHLYTRMYFAGDEGLEADPILALVAPDRRQTLMATQAASGSAEWTFDIRLQGDGETVFFDL
jgi:protocatechuate 3,4-dioxygenase alpha subunit